MVLHHSRALSFVAVLKQALKSSRRQFDGGRPHQLESGLHHLNTGDDFTAGFSLLGRSLPGWLSLPSLTALCPCNCSFIPTFSGPAHQAQECTVRVKQEPRASGSSREVPTGGSSQEGTPTAVARRSQPSVLLSGYEVPQEALQGAGDQPLSRLERVAR